MDHSRVHVFVTVDKDIAKAGSLCKPAAQVFAQNCLLTDSQKGGSIGAWRRLPSIHEEMEDYVACGDHNEFNETLDFVMILHKFLKAHMLVKSQFIEVFR